MVRNRSLRSDPGHTESEDSLDTQCGYIWNGYILCKKLKAFAKPQYFLIALILQGILLSAAEIFIVKTILSTKFGVPYSTTKWLILGSEIVLLILAVPVILCGSKQRRPGWLAGSAMFLSVCIIIFSAQLLTDHTFNRSDNYSSSKDVSLCQPWLQFYRVEKWKWNWFTIIIIPVLHFAVGISIISFWAFGIGYIDDNANNAGPLLIGIALALKQFGPFLGLWISSLSTTVPLMGIYWLILGAAILLSAIITGMFPKVIAQSNSRQVDDSGILFSLKRIFTNKVIIFSGLSATFLLTFIINASSLEEKYIESTFYVAGNSLFATIFSVYYLYGILKPTVAALSLIISAVIIYRIKPRPLILCIWSIITIFLSAGAVFAIIFLKCSDTPIHTGNMRNSLEESCNTNCGCSEDMPFTPSCSPYFPFVYYSPCHAGCTTVISDKSGRKIYSNCLCIQTGMVEIGHCNGGKCKLYWWLFQIAVLLTIAFLSSGIIGNLLICFRSILPCDKTIMIGVIFTISSFIARVPFKILYDLIADWLCLYSVDSQCKIYDSDKLTIYINLFHICLLLCAAGMLTFTCFLVQNLPLYRNQSAVKNNSEPMTEMTDFRSQLNQALKVRRESNAEEQKLLNESTAQTSGPHGHGNGDRASFIEEDSNKKSSINGQKNNTLPKPLVPIKSPIVKDNSGNIYSSSNSILPPTKISPDGKPSLQRPPVPVKSSALINEIKSSLNSSSVNSTPPSSADTTVRKQGYLTTLL